MKQEGEGKLRGSKHHLNPVNVLKADNNTENETILKTEIEIYARHISILSFSSSFVLRKHWLRPINSHYALHLVLV